MHADHTQRTWATGHKSCLLERRDMVLCDLFEIRETKILVCPWMFADSRSTGEVPPVRAPVQPAHEGRGHRPNKGPLHRRDIRHRFCSSTKPEEMSTCNPFGNGRYPRRDTPAVPANAFNFTKDTILLNHYHNPVTQLCVRCVNMLNN